VSNALYVATDARVHPTAVVERIVRLTWLDVARATDDIWHDFDVARHARDAKSLEMPEPRRPADLGLLPERPLILLLRALDEAAHLQAPRLNFLLRESELRIRNAHLGAPALRVDARRDFPDGIPGVVRVIPANAERVELHARRIDLEECPAEVIVVSVDDDLKPVRLHVRIASHEPSPDSIGTGGVEHPCRDIERSVIVQEPYFRALRGRFAFLWIDLREVSDRSSLAPGVLVDVTVDLDGV
jgi:hypothetical protein